MNQTNNGAEERLQAEIDDLKRQLAQRKANSGGPSGAHAGRPRAAHRSVSP